MLVRERNPREENKLKTQAIVTSQGINRHGDKIVQTK